MRKKVKGAKVIGKIVLKKKKPVKKKIRTKKYA